MQPQSKEAERTVDSIWTHVKNIERIFRRYVSFGHPNHPVDPTYTTPQAGSTAAAHNGLLDNIQGSWAEAVFTDFGPERFYHNLGVSVVPGVSYRLNVRWLNFGMSHDDAGTAPANSTMTVYKKVADPVAVNYIDLRLSWLPGARDVDADHPVKVTLFFIPAVRG
jgi:hypothetical protein